MACSSSRVLSKITLPSASSTRVKVRASRYTPSLGKVAKAVAISRVLTPRDRPPRDRGAMAMSLTVCPLMVCSLIRGRWNRWVPYSKPLAGVTRSASTRTATVLKESSTAALTVTCPR